MLGNPFQLASPRDGYAGAKDARSDDLHGGYLEVAIFFAGTTSARDGCVLGGYRLWLGGRGSWLTLRDGDGGGVVFHFGYGQGDCSSAR